MKKHPCPKWAAIWTTHCCHIFCKMILRETCFFFRQVWTLRWRSMYWIKSLSAQSYPDHWLPSNSASQKAIPRAFVPPHMGGARLREAERHWHLHPEWFQMNGADTQLVLLTQLLINNPRTFAPHILLCVLASKTHLHCVSLNAVFD